MKADIWQHLKPDYHVENKDLNEEGIDPLDFDIKVNCAVAFSPKCNTRYVRRYDLENGIRDNADVKRRTLCSERTVASSTASGVISSQ